MNESEPVAIERPEIETMLKPISGNFLLPERVVLGPDGNSATGYMKVRAGTECTDGHFGVLPGVMQIEFAQQILGVLLGKTFPHLSGVMHGVERVEIGMMAKVGDTIEAEVRVVECELKANKGRPIAEAVVRKAGDSTRVSTMRIIPQVMPRALFERLAGIGKQD